MRDRTDKAVLFGYVQQSGGKAIMTRYHFHLRSGDELALDDEGAEFEDYAAALHEATLAARELLVEAIKASKLHVADAFVIADASGNELGTFPLATFLPKPFGPK